MQKIICFVVLFLVGIVVVFVFVVLLQGWYFVKVLEVNFVGIVVGVKLVNGVFDDGCVVVVECLFCVGIFIFLDVLGFVVCYLCLMDGYDDIVQVVGGILCIDILSGVFIMVMLFVNDFFVVLYFDEWVFVVLVNELIGVVYWIVLGDYVDVFFVFKGLCIIDVGMLLGLV